MAQELVLVPKIKYEYLLKRADEYDSNIQSGNGKAEKGIPVEIIREQNEDSKRYTDVKTDNSSDHEKDKQPIDESETDSNIQSSKKLNLFVQAPLSHMGFSQKSKNSSKKRKANVKSSTTKRSIPSKMNSKSKWINYII